MGRYILCVAPSFRTGGIVFGGIDTGFFRCRENLYGGLQRFSRQKTRIARPLLLCEDLYLILVHEGGTGETGSLQLAQLLAQLLGLRQNGDVVGVAQLCGFGQHGGEVHVAVVEQGGGTG